MMKRELKHLIPGIGSLTALSLLGMFVVFPAFEPMIATSAESQITISQSITSELSITTPPTNVTMSPTIPGLSGGTSYGYAYVIVSTNNATGYTMTIAASSSPAMQGVSQGGTIPNYTPASAGVPDYAFSVGSNTGEFGYTVSASTTADLDQSFKDNGSNACNTGSNDTDGMTQGSETCWLNLSTSPETIVNRSSATPGSGATTSIKFKITISANPSPAIPQDTYRATSTITATAN